jgi:hypothetical protein
MVSEVYEVVPGIEVVFPEGAVAFPAIADVLPEGYSGIYINDLDILNVLGEILCFLCVWPCPLW